MILTIYLLLLGVCLGSFVNALVWRMRQQLDDDGEPRRLSKSQRAKFSITRGRSMCPHCKHGLGWTDLVPVLSWVALRGKCRYCHAPISLQYPVVELVTGLLFVGSYVFWPNSLDAPWLWLQFVAWLFALVAMIALAIYDLHWMLLPDRILLPTIGVVGVSVLVQFALGRPLDDASAILWSIVVCSGIFWLVFQLGERMGRELIGYGDVKLGILLGLLIASPVHGALMLFLASLLGVAVSAVLALGRKISRHDYWAMQIPFGPYLIAGCYVAVLWGGVIVDWYLSLLNF